MTGAFGTAGALLLAACASGGTSGTPAVVSGPFKPRNAQLSISWWGAQDRTTRTLDALKLYTQLYPGITFQPSYGGIVGYQAKMATEFAGGGAPDLMQVALAGPFIANHSLLDLDPYIKAGRLDLSGANQATLNAQRVDGSLYTIPWGLSVNCFFYNKALFQAAGVSAPTNGWTWDDYVDTLRQLAAKLPKGVYASEDIWAPAGTLAWPPFQLYLLSRGIQPYKDNGLELNFTQDDLAEWFSFWYGLLKQGYLPPASVSAEENAIQTSPFVKGEAALYPINSSIASSLQALMKDELGIVTLPTGYKSARYLPAPQFGEYVNTSIIIGANAQTQYLDDVVDVINFFITNPAANKITQMSRGVPLTSAIAELVSPLVTPIERQMVTVIDYVQTNSVKNVQAFPSADAQINTLMENTQQAVAFGTQSASDAASSFFAQAKTILESGS